MFGRFAYLGQLGHLAMVTVPIGSVIAGLNVGALAHQLGSLFPAKWFPNTGINKARLFPGWEEGPPGYNLVDHVIQDALVLVGIYRFAAPPEKLLLHSHLTILPFTSHREYFNQGVSTLHSVAVEVVRHLHCGVGTYRQTHYRCS
ncbi:hypothetical protein DSO57_1037611 [Entomophthora muscae]|uniref:Uncharacterized protein n=1 Tax=Entomophthora muscae TaxID=34485 RepID=A0ACC2SN87_9FUNG|nr:hypothetical protein DSO57_1037611 [Entomophthora muscae]